MNALNDVTVGKGKYKDLYEGKGVYAARDFDRGEVVIRYNLQQVSQRDFTKLPKTKQDYVHSFWGKMYLFSEPACWVNHASHANTEQDLEKMCDVAIEPIEQGEMITTNAHIEIKNELQTFVEAHEGKKPMNFEWMKGGYRNAVIKYSLPNKSTKKLVLKRIDGNWRIIKDL